MRAPHRHPRERACIRPRVGEPCPSLARADSISDSLGFRRPGNAEACSRTNRLGRDSAGRVEAIESQMALESRIALRASGTTLQGLRPPSSGADGPLSHGERVGVRGKASRVGKGLSSRIRRTPIIRRFAPPAPVGERLSFAITAHDWERARSPQAELLRFQLN
jgi:hypothetical protein